MTIFAQCCATHGDSPACMSARAMRLDGGWRLPALPLSLAYQEEDAEKVALVLAVLLHAAVHQKCLLVCDAVELLRKIRTLVFIMRAPCWKKKATAAR